MLRMRIIESLVRDLRFALGVMRRTPIVSGVAMLSLALGIGANVAVFNLVNALMLKALPIHAPEQLVVLGQPPRDPGRQPNRSFTYPQWEYLRDHQDFFATVLAAGNARFNLQAGGEARPATGLYVNGRFLDALGVRPYVGRTFTEADDRRGGGADGPVTMISYPFWQREYGGRTEVVGQIIHLDGHAFTIIGVTPPEFFGITVGRSFDVAVPFGAEPLVRGAESVLDRRSAWWLNVLARLAPGQTIEQASARFEAFRPGLRDATMPQDWRPQDQQNYLATPYQLDPAATGISGLRISYRRPLVVLLAIVAVVLLIACANLANLMMAQAAARQKELAVRLSLGASRWQIARQLLLESLLLSSLGAAGGVLLAVWGSRALVQLISTRTNIVSLDLSLDWRVLAFTVGVGLVTGLFFGVAPALRTMSLSPASALRDHARGVVSSSSRIGMGHGLVMLQVALSFVLVFGASLFVRTLVGLTSHDLGFQQERVLIAQVDLRRTGLADTQRPEMFERLRDAIAVAPGVEAAAVSLMTPISGMVWNNVVSVPGYEAPERERGTNFNRVTADYFTVMGTPIVAGRDVAPTDRVGTPNIVVVNDAFARKYFNGQNPLGKTFTLGLGGPRTTTLQIAGIAADAKYLSLREPPPPTIYTAWAQEATASSQARISIRVTGPADASRATVLSAIQRVEKEAVVDFRTLEEDVRASVIQERLIASLSAFFGALALLLAALGLYGVMSYAVARRRNEIGIRMALGAAPGEVMRLVLGHVAVITASGVIIGLAVSIGLGRFVNALLFELVATDATMVVVAAITLGTTAAVAGYLPARRAARVDPMMALRED
jgi:putative ABC transport system permease protein